MFKTKTAFKYVFSKSNGNKSTSVFIIIGIALSLCSLILILSVMDALQTSQLDRFRLVKTFDIVVKSDSLSKGDLQNIYGVDKAFEFVDCDVLFTNSTSGNSVTGKLRALDENIYSDNKFVFTDNFDGLLLSSFNIHKLGADRNDSIIITFLKKGKTNLVVPFRRQFDISGMYISDLSEFNSTYSLIPLNIIKDLDSTIKTQFGIYAKNLRDIKGIKDTIYAMDSNAYVSDWKENNGIIYSSMQLEKNVIFIILLIVCCIVCINLKNSTSRLINSRIKEAGILRSIGMTQGDIVHIFILYGLIITLSGELLGLLLAVLLIKNFALIMNALDSLLSIFGSYNFLSSFNLDLRLTASSTLVFFSFVLIIALLFIFFGIKKALKKDVMEVILNAAN